jgi:hypothetical protein
LFTDSPKLPDDSEVFYNDIMDCSRLDVGLEPNLYELDSMFQFPDAMDHNAAIESSDSSDDCSVLDEVEDEVEDESTLFS